jgi:hypothetical protein
MLSAADQAIFAAIEAHRAALDALDQCVATLGDAADRRRLSRGDCASCLVRDVERGRDDV